MTVLATSELTGNIQKGGALLDDCRRVVEVWNPNLTLEDNLAYISRENPLGKTSHTRVDDLLLRIIRPRFVDPGSHVLPALKGLLDDSQAFREACYYETGRDDALLANFAEGPLWSWWKDGRIGISVDDAIEWLDVLAYEGHTSQWSLSVRTKVARGLLAALRDFGVLRGAVRKEISAPSMSPLGFAYVAWREYEQGSSSRALISSPIWHRWLLDDDRVLDLFGQAAQLRVLRLSRAGSAVRIDWLAKSLAEVTGAAT